MGCSIDGIGLKFLVSGRPTAYPSSEGCMRSGAGVSGRGTKEKERILVLKVPVCVVEKGQLNEREVVGIQAFIKKHYREMYLKWSEMSDTGFYEGR